MKKGVVAAALVAALVVAGGAAAAGRWVVSNIGQIKPSVRAQLRGNRGPRGFQGAQGPRGPSASSMVVAVRGPVTTLTTLGTANDAGTSVAKCPAGTVVTGGGWDGLPAPMVSATVAFNEPLGDGSGWEVIAASDNGVINQTFRAYALCISTGSGAARDTGGSTAAEVARQVAEVRAQRR